MKIFLFLALLFFSFNSFTSEKIFPLEEEDRTLYSKVYEEVQYVLQKNHFNNNISLKKSEMVKKYIHQIDSQKIIFTETSIKELETRY